MSGGSAQAEEFLTVEEAAAILKVKPSTLRGWVREGRIPCYRLGPRATRFTRVLVAESTIDRAVRPIQSASSAAQRASGRRGTVALGA